MQQEAAKCTVPQDQVVVETQSAHVGVDDEGNTKRINDYWITKFLGQGAYAAVYECEKRLEGENTYPRYVSNANFM